MGACKRLSSNVKRRCGTVIKIGTGRVLMSMLNNYSNEQNKLSTVLQVFRGGLRNEQRRGISQGAGHVHQRQFGGQLYGHLRLLQSSFLFVQLEHFSPNSLSSLSQITWRSWHRWQAASRIAFSCFLLIFSGLSCLIFSMARRRGFRKATSKFQRVANEVGLLEISQNDALRFIRIPRRRINLDRSKKGSP